MDKLLFLLYLLKSILILCFIFKCSVIIFYYNNNIRIVYIIIYLYIYRKYFIIIYYYSILRRLSKILSLINKNKFK